MTPTTSVNKKPNNYFDNSKFGPYEESIINREKDMDDLNEIIQ